MRVETVAAMRLTKPRLIGDIGLRALLSLYKKARKLIKNEKFDFLYIPIPSFYCALLGRWLHSATGIRYGIDYIDPWVHLFPGSSKIFSRHWFSTQLAKILEPIALNRASLVTGVAEGYYQPVLERNPSLKDTAITGSMPYGGEAKDHDILHQLNLPAYLFKPGDKFQLVYAGAMLPKAYAPLESIFKSIAANRELFHDVEFHFIGTGKSADDPRSYNIRPLAEKYSLWKSVIFEYPRRIPYLDVLVHLSVADAIFILGSTEPHYTPSKTYQGVLSGKPLAAVLHQDSTAVQVIRDSRAGLVLDFKGADDVDSLETGFISFFKQFREFAARYNKSQVSMETFDAYSARNVTGQLAALLNKALAV